MGNQRENELALINALRNFFPRRKANADREPYSKTPAMPTRVFPNPGSGFLATPIRYEFPFYRMVVETVPSTGARIYVGFTPNATTSNVYALGVGQILECDFGADEIYVMGATAVNAYTLRFEPDPYVRTRY